MLKKVKVKNILVWNIFFLAIATFFILFLHIEGKEKLSYIGSPEFFNYIENEADADEIKSIAISHSQGMHSLYKGHYYFFLIFISFIIVNVVLLTNEHINQRKKTNKIQKSRNTSPC